MKENLKLSIITPSYNQCQFIEQTIESVLNQDYKNFEHIIVDGDSTDDTIEVLKKYKHLIWSSEKDKGQGNAINKGFAKSTGQIFAWLNSDDYFEQNIFSLVTKYFEDHKDCDFLYGDITYVGKMNNNILQINGEEITFENLLSNPDLIRQPSFFWRKNIFEDNGGLDESLDLVMDYDLFLKFTKHKKPGYINKNLSYYRYYDETKTKSKRRKQAVEIYKVMKRHAPKITLQMKKFLFKRYFGSFKLIAELRKIQKSIHKSEK